MTRCAFTKEDRALLPVIFQSRGAKNSIYRRKIALKKRVLLTIVIVMFVVTAAQMHPVFANDYDDASQLSSQLNAATRPDHVALTWSADPRVSMTVTWRTSTEVRQCQLEYTDAGNARSVKVAVKPELFQTVDKDPNQGDMHLFSVTLQALKSGVTYSYRISNDRSEWTETSSFTTESLEAVRDNKFKFLVFGDSQSGNKDVPDYNDWHKTVQNAFTANSDARFFINMGDLVETGQSYRHWQNWFSSAKGVIDSIPALPVQGNHETYNAKDFITAKPVYFTKQFRVFSNGPDGLKGQTYSFNYGKTHFVVLDSQGEEESLDARGKAGPAKEQQFYADQTAWLKTDLEQNRSALFTLVFFHKTPYYNKGNRTNSLLKKTFCPIFDQYHVDVVFSGHDHATSRTYPIRSDQFVQSPAEGTVYYVTGRSGAKYYADLTPKVWDARFYDPQDQPDYQTVELEGGRLNIKAFRQDGSKLDEYVIDKDHPENNTSDREPLPSKYRSDSLKLILFGSMAAGSKNQAILVNNKAYADIRAIALASDGGFLPEMRTLLLPKKIYEFTADMLTDNEKKVSIDGLNAMGWSNHYDPVYNMVFIEK
jgi:3',5'-cyclic AMP phosphodiesterase CpdA